MAKTRNAEILRELLNFLATETKIKPHVLNYGPVRRRIQVARFMNYPTSGLTTFVTLGASRLPVSIWRGLDVGFELTLTLAKTKSYTPQDLAKAVLSNLRRGDSEERRPFIEYNGIYAPGYPPHLLFTDQVSCTPKISGRKRFSDRWITFLAAIPLDDVELRDYDRSVPKLIAKIRNDGRIADYPRR